MRRSPLALLLLATAALTGCSDDPPAAKERMVVGVYPVEWLVRQLVGEGVTVTNVVPPGVEPHDVELTPRQVAESEGAVVLRIAGFQPALDELGGTDLWEGEGLDPLELDGERDPHLWLDPVRMKALARNVEQVRTEAGLPAREGGLAAVESALDELDRDIRAQLTGCRSRDVVTSHAAFGYFTDRYGLTQRGIAGLSPESEPSPAKLAEVARYAKQRGVTTIFFESLVSPKVAQTVAKEVGVRTAMLDPLESVEPGDDYLSVMRRNAATLNEALGCR